MDWLLIYVLIGALIWLYTGNGEGVSYFFKCVFGWAFYGILIILILIFDRK